jgi:pimeloyl-ACP methyl ester carboxylesterase
MFRGLYGVAAIGFTVVLTWVASRVVAQAASAAYAVSDPVPSLLEGAKVTTDVAKLAEGGRAVLGVAADGVSEVVISVNAASAGQQLAFQVLNDKNQPSVSPSEDGALATVEEQTFDQSKVTVNSVSTPQGPRAFVIYQAPLDFARPGGADDAASQRGVSISWQVSGGGETQSAPITIIRPLVVLVHGLWGAPSDWDDFKPLISDPRFSVRRADYSFYVGLGLSSTTPSYTTVAIAEANSLGFYYNAGQVAQQIDSFIESFKRGSNPSGVPVAAVEADVVGHSMGGDVTRTMLLWVGFGSDRTFGQGNVHKLITVDTPHLGSPLATNLLQDNNSCVRDTFATAGMYSFLSVTTAFTDIEISGAIGDLRANLEGKDLSPALRSLQPGSNVPLQVPHLLPTAYLAGWMSQAQLDGLNNPPYLVQAIRYWCKGDSLADNLTVDGWPKVVGAQSDAIVPLLSEVNGGSAFSTVTAIHSPGVEQLGFLPPSALDEVTDNPSTAITLLNTWVKSSAYVELR